LFCLLGGYGITYAVNDAAWKTIRRADLTTGTPEASEIEAVLREPLEMADGTHRRYRFPSQRAARLAAAIRMLDHAQPPADAVSLRNWLTGLPGIGPKTASWIVRNRLADDRIAVIDIHVQRAGLAAGFFSTRWRLPRDYGLFEAAFCAIARMGDVGTAALDLTIWEQLSQIGRARHLLLGPSSVLVSG
jgi:thermostable 8-oxoguanine DNA glycosylase